MIQNGNRRTLHDIAVGLTALDIATPEGDLTCWTIGTDRQPVLAKAEPEALDLTYIPVRDSNKTICGVLPREELKAESPVITPLTQDWLVAADTPIFELVRLFIAVPDRVFFVLHSSRIAGLVAPADLDKTVARASFYLLIAEFERRLAGFIRAELPKEDDYCQYLTEDRVEKIRAEKNKASSKGLNLDLLHYMYLSDLGDIARKDQSLSQKLGKPSESFMNSIIQVRNAVDHPANLFTSRKKLRDLYKVYQGLLKLEKRMKDAARDNDLKAYLKGNPHGTGWIVADHWRRTARAKPGQR